MDLVFHGAPATKERIEDEITLLPRNARTAVHDTNFHGGSAAVRRRRRENADPTVPFCPVHPGIADQVLDSMFHGLLIGEHQRQIRFEILLDNECSSALCDAA